MRAIACLIQLTTHSIKPIFIQYSKFKLRSLIAEVDFNTYIQKLTRATMFLIECERVHAKEVNTKYCTHRFGPCSCITNAITQNKWPERNLENTCH